ncbi:MAG: carbon-nitrogen family hydrolase [Ruminococcaceae bacterium]|nr:carbon-nitrogen family hydrolase [Oscillospiraceae bacterium]
MKVSCIQMASRLFEPEWNYPNARRLLREAASERPDVIVLPEFWNTGFYPRKTLLECCDRNGERTKREIGALAAEFAVNIVAGSVVSRREDGLYNTAYVFDRKGCCIAAYDKRHLYPLSHEDAYFTPGDHLSTFRLDGVLCGIMLCYDIRFPELSRSLAEQGVKVLFLPVEWPTERIDFLRELTVERAVQNGFYVVSCNCSGSNGRMCFGGGSAVIDPQGKTLVLSGETEETIRAELPV